MKHFIRFLILICMLSPTVAHAYSTTIDEAAEAARLRFGDRDIDIYGIDSNSPTYWWLFIDAEPMAGWEHECYYAFVPKDGPIQQENISWTERTMPPSGITPFAVDVKDRYGSNANIKPLVKKWNVGSNPIQPSEAAGRTYALIISGGVDMYSNHERYWNDCSDTRQ